MYIVTNTTIFFVVCLLLLRYDIHMYHLACSCYLTTQRGWQTSELKVNTSFSHRQLNSTFVKCTLMINWSLCIFDFVGYYFSWYLKCVSVQGFVHILSRKQRWRLGNFVKPPPLPPFSQNNRQLSTEGSKCYSEETMPTLTSSWLCSCQLRESRFQNTISDIPRVRVNFVH